MIENTINQRLKILIEALNMNIRSFSKAYRLHEGNIRNYIDRGSKPPAEFIGALIQSIDNINPHWLLLGKGEMFLVGAPATASIDITTKKNKAPVLNSNSGDNTINNYSIEDCRRELEATQQLVGQLKEQLTMKDALLSSKDDVIAAKEEMLALLRAGHNRPN